MIRKSEDVVPRSRKAGLVVKALNDEVLVYDLVRDRAHSLNRAASFVWKQCNGRRTITEVAQLLGQELDVPADEQTVWFALEQLSSFHLLDGIVSRPVGVARVSRRDMMRIASASAFALPVIISIIAPTAANAQTAISPSVCNARSQPSCGGTPCTGGGGPRFCTPFAATACKCQ